MNIETSDDSALIARSLGGDESAFQTLIERYQDRVLRLLSRYARDRMECEDLGQEVFVKIFRKLHTFQGESSFFTWVYRIAVNTATDHLGKHRRKLHLVDDPATLDDGTRELGHAGSAEPLLEDELRRVTREVLATLPDKYRTILVLREYEDLSYTAMAEVIGCSIGTVESRLFRARARFKDALERMHPELVPQVRGGQARGGAR